MNSLLREHGFGIALLIGIVLLVIGLVGSRLDAIIIGAIFAIVGVVARPVEEAQWSFTSARLKWQKDVARLVEARLEARLEGSFKPSGELTVKKIPGKGEDVRAEAGVAEGQGHANAAAAITHPQTADEFAETLVEKVIRPIVVEPGTIHQRATTHPPEVRVSVEPDDGAP